MTPAGGAPGAALGGLRDYHLPEAVAWWPPAPGWWLLAGLLLVVGLALGWWGARRWQRRAPARVAQRELAQLRTTLARQGDRAAYLRGLSRLLRRYVRAAFPGEPTAALTGDAWLAFLDANGGGGRFGAGPGRQLAEAPYRPTAPAAADQLGELVEDWIRRNREVWR